MILERNDETFFDDGYVAQLLVLFSLRLSFGLCLPAVAMSSFACSASTITFATSTRTLHHGPSPTTLTITTENPYADSIPSKPRESTTPNVSVTPTALSTARSSLVDGHCTRKWKYSGWSDWHCKRKGFVCEDLWAIEYSDDVGGVCVDRRSPAQREADRQEAADGRAGRCSFRFKDGYFCMQRGFVCVNESRCEDHRTPEELAKDKTLDDVSGGSSRCMCW